MPKPKPKAPLIISFPKKFGKRKRVSRFRGKPSLSVEDLQHDIEINHVLIARLDEALKHFREGKYNVFLNDLDDTLTLHGVLVSDHKSHGGKESFFSKKAAARIEKLLSKARGRKGISRFELEKQVRSLLDAIHSSISAEASKLKKIHTLAA